MTHVTKTGVTVIRAPAPAPLKVPANPTRPISTPAPARAPAAPVRTNVPVPQRKEKVQAG